MGSDNDGKRGPGVVRKMLGLRWWTPVRALPHGMCGLVSMVSGAVLVASALSGFANYNRDAWFAALTVVYLVATMGNAVAGYLLSGTALKAMQTPFKLASLLQGCLVYFAFRFFLIGEHSNSGNSAMAALDCAFSIAIVVIITVTMVIAWKTVDQTFGPIVATSISVGCISLYLLSGYPLQLAFNGGEEWYQCVMREYPLQRQGFVYYVYIPATFSFGAMLFGATLAARKIISNTFFGLFFVALVLATLFSTVLLQEVHIPWVSTQKLLINCRETPTSDLMRSLAETLDTSLLAQSVLKMFNAHTPKPSFSNY